MEEIKLVKNPLETHGSDSYICHTEKVLQLSYINVEAT